MIASSSFVANLLTVALFCAAIAILFAWEFGRHIQQQRRYLASLRRDRSTVREAKRMLARHTQEGNVHHDRHVNIQKS